MGDRTSGPTPLAHPPRQTETTMSTATRGAHPISDGLGDSASPSTSHREPTRRPHAPRIDAPATGEREVPTTGTAETSETGRTAPRQAAEMRPAEADTVEAELHALLDHALRMLPRACLEPVVVASCPWYSDLPPAVARQCLGELESAREGAGVEGVLRTWRVRAEPFAR